MRSDAAISVDRISKSYGDFRAVSNLSFDVEKAEIFAMLGPNGSGKTTTMRMILDILKPDQGKIAVLGGPLTDATKDRIGYLPEERGLYRSVRVADMMEYLATLKGVPPREARKRSLAMLERLGLAEHARKKVSELSKGMQQKIQFAVTVLHDPKLIIIDEPFSGLDPVNALALKDLLFEFKAKGGTVVMSTHQMSQVEEMCDRLLMIDRGVQKLYGPVDDIRRQYALHAIIVEGQGNWASLPGVEKVEFTENGRKSAMLHLKASVTPDAVLSAIAADPNMRIERFELAVPSLNDIFIRVVEGTES
ncbi:MAG: ATP-binding cassette domain-containing protein [Anaerolineae bacterium]|nr:ATP-binding cassette domain-containing protein [Anaerolineae bacterium]